MLFSVIASHASTRDGRAQLAPVRPAWPAPRRCPPCRCACRASSDVASGWCRRCRTACPCPPARDRRRGGASRLAPRHVAEMRDAGVAARIAAAHGEEGAGPQAAQCTLVVPAQRQAMAPGQRRAARGGSRRHPARWAAARSGGGRGWSPRRWRLTRGAGRAASHRKASTRSGVGAGCALALSARHARSRACSSAAYRASCQAARRGARTARRSRCARTRGRSGSSSLRQLPSDAQQLEGVGILAAVAQHAERSAARCRA